MKLCEMCKGVFDDDISFCGFDGKKTIDCICPGPPLLEGKYLLVSRIGQGGMGAVYRARHNFLKTAHAIKLILPDLIGNDPNLVTRFRQEGIAGAATRHQNIVNTTDFGVINGKIPFIVMEFVEGESLHDLLERQKRLSLETTLEILTGICAGLAEAHGQKIVHRDLKPQNIILCAGKPLVEAAKILDFGLAKVVSGELLRSFIQAQTTGLMGSPLYMAPERWSDDEPDARTDIYSLGVMLYQMLTGVDPFKGSSIASIMRKHLSDPPPLLARSGLNLDPNLEAVVAHSLQKDRENRTQSVQQFIFELKSAIGRSNAQTPVIKERYTTPLFFTNSPQSKIYFGGGLLRI